MPAIVSFKWSYRNVCLHYKYKSDVKLTSAEEWNKPPPPQLWTDSENNCNATVYIFTVYDSTKAKTHQQKHNLYSFSIYSITSLTLETPLLILLFPFKMSSNQRSSNVIGQGCKRLTYHRIRSRNSGSRPRTKLSNHHTLKKDWRRYARIRHQSEM